ncbi:hypothetical protein D3C85_1065590 [compost metagenome]
MLHGKVNHVFAFPRIVYGLRRPNPFKVIMSLVDFLDVDYGVFPVNKVIGFHQYHRAVRIPSFGGCHIGYHHEKGAAIC